MKIHLLSAVIVFISSALFAAQSSKTGRVQVTQDQNSFALSNGIVTARIDKSSGDLTSLVFNNLQMLGNASGHPGAYWSHSAAGGKITDAITIDPKANGGDMAEVSIKGISGGYSLGNGPGGSTVCDIEIRYCLSRDLPGIYTCCVFTHRPTYPATSIGEARFAAKLNDSLFDWMTIDARRNKLMISAEDWNRGTTLNMKEVRRINTGIDKDQVEHKYDYSAVQFDTPAFGWSSTHEHVGFWFINPSMEYLSGGATKLELTSHRDVNAGAAPVMLNYWRGSHYGGSICVMDQGESWTKVVGPFLIYCNNGPTPQAMWNDALREAASETNKWPYGWVHGVDYPHADQRSSVQGKLDLDDPAGPEMKHLLVGLAHPDYPSRDWRGGKTEVDWQLDAKYYEFWTRGDEHGNFRIEHVRPGTYTLHAIADNVLGEFAQSQITVKPGETINLGSLHWHPVRYGRQLWEIGVPDRTAGEFFHGDHYWQWGLYNQYPTDFPHDVHFVIGKSDWRRDWNIMQVPRGHDQSGRGYGDSTTWSVQFILPKQLKGRVTLRLGLAGTEARSIHVAMNGKTVGAITNLFNTTVIHRDADRGYWQERDLAFDASTMKMGTNVLTLTIPSGPVTAGVEYDYLRLELTEDK